MLKQSHTSNSVDLAESLSGQLLGDSASRRSVAVQQDDLGASVDALERGNLQSRDGVLEAAGIAQGATESLRMETQSVNTCEYQLSDQTASKVPDDTGWGRTSNNSVYVYLVLNGG